MIGETLMGEKIRSRKALLIHGLLCGIAFGFLLQRGQLTKYDKILGVLLLVDFTVVKVMLTAVVVGMIGIYAMRDLGLVELQVKPASLGANMIGGLIFGAGFALLGYCPGTCVGAVGQGSLDALLAGLPGMLLGASLFAVVYPLIKDNVLKWRDFGKVTIPGLLKVNHWLVIAPVVLVLCGMLLLLERYGPY